MNRMNDPGRYWGPGLIIMALLMVLTGYLGTPLIESRKYALGVKHSSDEQAELHRTWKVRQAGLQSSLDRLGAEEFRIGSDPTANLDIAISAELDEMIVSSVEDLAEAVSETFPDHRFVVRAWISFLGSMMSFNVQKPTWHSMSTDLPAGASESPSSYLDSRGVGNGVPIRIQFLLPAGMEGEERWRSYNTLNSYFLSSSLKRLDVAGNETIIGALGEVRLAAYLERGEYPLRAYSIAIWIMNRMGTLGLILLLVAPPVWVFLDARKRRLPAVLWGLFTLPTSFVGALIYALGTREAGPTCPECGERVSTRFVVCPYCQTELKGTCSTCGQTVGLNWHYCPSCATEL